MRKPVAALLLALWACGPNPKPPVNVMAVIPDASGTYTTKQVQLTTLDSLTSFKGAVAQFMGGNRVVVDANDPMVKAVGGIQNMTDEQRYDVLVKDKGMDVHGNFIDKSGILWPADFHTWNMTSMYWNFEQAFTYYQGVVGKDPDELKSLRVMYWPDVRMQSDTPLADNALYLSFIRSFVIVPFKATTKVPLAMNIGVIGHELAHKVFGKRVYDDQGVPAPLTTWNGQAFNLLKSMDEGIADFHGFGVTCVTDARCRPDFLKWSVDDEGLIHRRDVSRNDACMDATLQNAFNTFSPDMWVRDQSMYDVGNLIAASLYQAGSPKDKMQVLRRALLASYDDSTPGRTGFKQLISTSINTPQNFTPEAVADIIASHIADPELKMRWCNEVSDRLALRCTGFPCDLMPSCPQQSARGTTKCPAL